MRLWRAGAFLLLLAAPGDAFRFARPIEAKPGWARLTLPDDVLDACRPGLPDLRIVDGPGAEVPYAIELEPSDAAARFPAQNVESLEKIETAFRIDRGRDPGLATAVTLEVAGDTFLKPVRVQASDDGSSWRDVASGSIFAARGVRMTTLPIPDNDRRWLRFVLDDRNGPPLRPDGAAVWTRVGARRAALDERTLAVTPEPSGREGISMYTTALPAANLALSALRFRAQDPAFSRPVRVYERVFFRDEVRRRLVAQGILSRAPGAPEAIDLPTGPIAARSLEVEIADGDSPPLQDLRVAALARATTLRFVAPAGALTLRYGSPGVPAPRYDVARAVSGGRGAAPPAASLGPPVAVAGAASPVPVPSRAPLLAAETWPVRRPIALPASGSVAYLELDDLPRGVADLRIVDADDRQVPFVVERESHPKSETVSLDTESNGPTTRARIEGLRHAPAVTAIELGADGPDYFTRAVRVVEEERDARGTTGVRTLGSGRLERSPGAPPPILRIPIASPSGQDARLFVEIENGDNVSLVPGPARALSSATRIDFVFVPGERLFLLSGNPEARLPVYDLEMLAGAVLSAPAGPASAGPSPLPAPPAPSRPAWLLAAVGITAAFLVFKLARVVRPAA